MNKRDVVKLLVLRKPQFNPKNLHPKAMIKRTTYSQTPEPLKYKLQNVEALTPFDMFKPLGNTEHIPFKVFRAWTGNLPVYKEYKNRSPIPRTVIRHIEGDIVAFKQELSKVVSNAPIIEKIGRLEVEGSHKENVLKWLRGLGF